MFSPSQKKCFYMSDDNDVSNETLPLHTRLVTMWINSLIGNCSFGSSFSVIFFVIFAQL